MKLEREIENLQAYLLDEDSDGDLHVSGIDSETVANYVRAKMRGKIERIGNFLKERSNSRGWIVTGPEKLYFLYEKDIDEAVKEALREDP